MPDLKMFYRLFHAIILPQAIRFPEFPAGWEVKSSGMSCMITVRPSTSMDENRSVYTESQA